MRNRVEGLSEVKKDGAHFLSSLEYLKPIMSDREEIWPRVQICGNSGLPFAMVPCLHQSNLYKKRKLPEWRAQKCNPYFGAESPLRITGLQTTRFYAAPYRANCANLWKLGATFRYGTVQSLYEKEATGIESPKMKSLFRCRKPTS